MYTCFEPKCNTLAINGNKGKKKKSIKWNWRFSFVQAEEGSSKKLDSCLFLWINGKRDQNDYGLRWNERIIKVYPTYHLTKPLIAYSI